MEGSTKVHEEAASGAGAPDGSEPGGEYLGACAKHFTVRAVFACDDCGELWCGDCMVPKKRKRQPTRCIDCALVAAGIRAPGPRRSMITDMGRQNKRERKGFL
jgi:hypothetical protein